MITCFTCDTRKNVSSFRWQKLLKKRRGGLCKSCESLKITIRQTELRAKKNPEKYRRCFNCGRAFCSIKPGHNLNGAKKEFRRTECPHCLSFNSINILCDKFGVSVD